MDWKGQEKRASPQRTAFESGEHANCKTGALDQLGDKMKVRRGRGLDCVTILPAPLALLMHV